MRKLSLLIIFALTLSMVLPANTAKAANSKTIVINPGHSIGYDSGAVNSSTGVTEAQVNQDLAEALAKKLDEAGYTVYLTHTSNDQYKKYRLGSQADGSSLATACGLANAKNPDLVISIHHNSGGSSSTGMELYWSSYRSYDGSGVYSVGGLWGDGSSGYRDSSPTTEAQQSKVFAQKVVDAFKGSALPYRSTVERDDYFPAHAKAPCVLYEGGFISNNSESTYLNSQAYRDDASKRFLNAINSYFGVTSASTQSKAADVKLTSVTKSFDGDTTSDTVIKYSYKVSDPSAVDKITVGVWSEKDGQNDLKWYKADKSGDTFSVTFALKDHNNDLGKYFVHAYVTPTGGKQKGLSAQNFKVVMPDAVPDGFTIEKVSESKANVYLKGYDGNTFRIAVWSDKNGQDDLVWSRGTRQIDGSCRFVLDISNHNNDTGIYRVHAYYGSSGGIGAQTVELKGIAYEKSEVTTNEDGTFEIAIYGLTDAVKVQVPTWTSLNGQDDIKWYEPKKDGDVYRLTVDPKNHKDGYGQYNFHVYATNANGTCYPLAGLKAVREEPLAVEEITLSDPSQGKFTVNVTGLNQNTTISEVLVPVWSDENGQDDIIWHKAQKTDSGYTVTIDTRKEHFADTGGYQVHCYAKTSYGTMIFLGDGSLTVEAPSAGEARIQDNGDGTFLMTVPASEMPEGVTSASYFVFRDESGEDKGVEYPATLKDSAYQATADVKLHESLSGDYTIRLLSDGSVLSETKVNVTVPEVKEETKTEEKKQEEKKTEETKDAEQPAKAQQTQTAAATKSESQTSAFSPVSTGTQIMGKTTATKDQLVKLYQENSPISFPDYYVKRGVDLAAFAQMYIDEANAEGIRAEIAFGQAMHETGWLNFGGDVKISQFNFAGLGATGGGVRGEDFASRYGDNKEGIRMGIRAQIQHLKAYASAQGLNNPCVDTRYDYVSPKGKASTIAQLAGTWAADKNYAEKLVTIINKIK